MPADYLYFELNKVRDFKAANGDSRLVETELKSLIKKASLDFCDMWDSGGKKNPREFVNSKEFTEFMELYKASGNAILTVTVAPEIQGALDFIRKLSESGIIVALGHHNASDTIVDQAVANGARICTHMGTAWSTMVSDAL